MKYLLFILSFLIASEPSSAFSLWPTSGNGEPTSVRQHVTSFNKLEVDGPYQVKIESGHEDSIVISGESNMIEATAIEVQAGRLIIKEKKWLKPRKPLQVTIVKSNLSGLVSKGDSVIQWDELGSSNLELELMGSGKLRGQVKVDQNLTIKAFGSGSLEIKGQATRVSANASGSTNIILNLKDVQLANLEGNGSVRYFLEEANKVKATLHGASHFTFAGDPSAIQMTTTGSSQVSFEKR